MKRAKGSGTIVKIRGFYLARKRLDGVDVYGPKRESRAQAEQDLQKLRASSKPVSEIPTVGEWAHQCMNGKYGSRLRTNSFETNETIRTFWLNKSSLSKKKIVKITRGDCQAFIDGIARSPSYKKRIGSFLGAIFTEAIKAELIPYSPFVKIEYPRIEEREIEPLSPKQVQGLLAPKTWLETLILVALDTGLRRSELCGLKWKDVFPDRIHVRQSRIAVEGGHEEAKTKTKASEKAVPLTSEAYKAIQALPVRGDYVFTTPKGEPLSPRTVTITFRRWKKKLGFPDNFRLHDLRGSYISLLFESGADVRTVHDLARHADPKTTLKYYARSRASVRSDAIENLRKFQNRVTDKVTSPEEQS